MCHLLGIVFLMEDQRKCLSLFQPLILPAMIYNNVTTGKDKTLLTQFEDPVRGLSYIIYLLKVNIRIMLLKSSLRSLLRKNESSRPNHYKSHYSCQGKLKTAETFQFFRNMLSENLMRKMSGIILSIVSRC